MHRPALSQGVDRLRQAGHGRTWAWAGLSQPLHTPRGPRQPPHRRCAGRPGALSLPQPTPRHPRADHDAGGACVHPPLALAWRAPGLAAHAPYRFPGPPMQGAGPAPVPPTARPTTRSARPSGQEGRRVAVAGDGHGYHPLSGVRPGPAAAAPPAPAAASPSLLAAHVGLVMRQGPASPSSMGRRGLWSSPETRGYCALMTPRVLSTLADRPTRSSPRTRRWRLPSHPHASRLPPSVDGGC